MPPVPITLEQAVALTVAVIASFTDIRTGKIYNVLTFPSMLVGIVLTTVLAAIHATDGFFIGGAVSGLASAVGGCLCGMFIMMMMKLFLRQLGHGDTKLMGALGAFIGTPLICTTFFFFSIVYAVFCCGWLAASFPWRQLASAYLVKTGSVLDLQHFNSVRKRAIPIAPFIAAGLLCAIALQVPALQFLGVKQ